MHQFWVFFPIEGRLPDRQKGSMMRREPDSKPVICYFVGTEVGGVRGPATMVVRPSRLTIYIGLERYKLNPEQVLSFQKKSNELQINHTSPSCSAKFLISGTKPADKIIAEIEAIGFHPSANPQDAFNREGSALRRKASVIGVLIWNLLFLSSYIPKTFGVNVPQVFPIRTILGPGPLIAISLVFTLSIAARYIPIVQKLILKPGRDIGEISSGFDLLTQIMAMFLCESIAFALFGKTTGGVSILVVPVALFGHRLRAFLQEGV
jgi:hypothetical protein